jgi:hypothetical protein
VPKSKVKAVADQIIKLSEKAGLDVGQFGGKHCASGRPGHLLQIFLKRELVDKFVYAYVDFCQVFRVVCVCVDLPLLVRYLMEFLISLVIRSEKNY